MIMYICIYLCKFKSNVFFKYLFNLIEQNKTTRVLSK